LPGGDAKQILISLQATPSFEAFGGYLEAGNPFAFWAQAARLVWLPWPRGRARCDAAEPRSAAVIRRLGRRLANGMPGRFARRSTSCQT